MLSRSFAVHLSICGCLKEWRSEGGLGVETKYMSVFRQLHFHNPQITDLGSGITREVSYQKQCAREKHKALPLTVRYHSMIDFKLLAFLERKKPIN